MITRRWSNSILIGLTMNTIWINTAVSVIPTTTTTMDGYSTPIPISSTTLLKAVGEWWMGWSLRHLGAIIITHSRRTSSKLTMILYLTTQRRRGRMKCLNLRAAAVNNKLNRKDSMHLGEVLAMYRSLMDSMHLLMS
jgi:hypothetical protein